MPICGSVPYSCNIPFTGHPNVRSTHQTTIEITTDTSLTPRGDCIVGVGAGGGCSALPDIIKSMLRRHDSRIHITFQVKDNIFVVHGRGDPGLSLEHDTDIVIRKSRFLCSRTLAVDCDAASADMPRKMVADLQAGAGGTLVIDIEV